MSGAIVGTPRRIAIVGGGRMGVGIAETLVMAGLEVVIADATPELGLAARARLLERMADHAEAGLTDRDTAALAVAVRTADGVASAAEEPLRAPEEARERVDVERRGVAGDDRVRGRCFLAGAKHSFASITSSARVPQALRALVRQGWRGTSAGAGFYEYQVGDSDRLLLERDRRYAALSALLATLPPLEFDGGATPP